MTDQGSIQPAPDSETQGRWASVRRWVLRSSVAAVLLSLTVHLVMLVVASLLGFAGGGGPAGPPQRGSVEFAVMPESEFDAPASSDELSLDPPSAEELLSTDLESLENTQLDLDISSSLLRPDVTLDVELGSGGQGLSVDGGAAGGGAGGGSGASFFGIEARGNRFAYIVDVSGSMDRDGRMTATKRELSESITELLEHVGFFVVLYADDAIPLGNRREWTDATPVGKRWARGYLERVEPLGGTNPVPAFEIVMSIRPRPDAIYFMTDGDFNDAIAAQIVALNRERPTPIHCITFVTADAARLMQQIADASGGTYTHIAGGQGP